MRGASSGGNEAFDWRWDGKRYRRMVEGKPVEASAVVILYTLAGIGILDSGEFPDDLIAGDMEKAVVCVNRRAFEATWSHRALFTTGLFLGSRS